MGTIKSMIAAVITLSLIFNLTPTTYAQNINEAGVEDTNVWSPTATESVYEDTGEVQEYMIAFEEKVDIKEFIDETDMVARSIFEQNAEQQDSKITTVLLTESEKEQLEQNPEIKYIEPNSPVSMLTEGVPVKEGDAYTYRNVDGDSVSWGLYSIGGDQAHQAEMKGVGVKIAVLDTGIAEHADLRVNGGVSFVNGVANFEDDNGHGTFVAGIIGAQINGQGVAGVAPDAELYAVKVLDAEGKGTYAQVVNGIDWAINNQMNIISISFGGMESSEILREAVIRANDAGILVVAAAGNSGAGEETELYPARFGEVVSVGAVTRSFKRAIYSSTGAQLNLVAPGSDILSTTFDGDYGVLSGTSVAAPFVVGAAALLISTNPQQTPSELKSTLHSSATPLGEQTSYGSGIVNVAKAIGLNEDPIPPIFLGSDTNEDEEWIPPIFEAQDGEVSILAYGHRGNGQSIVPGESATVSLILSAPKSKVYIGVFNPAGVKIGDGEFTNVSANVPIEYTWNTSSGLTPGTYKIKYAYSGTTLTDFFTIYVTATQSNATPVKPTGLYISSYSDSGIRINWNDMGGGLQYIVRLNGSTVTTTMNKSYTFTGLQPNTQYVMQVLTTNASGERSDDAIIYKSTLFPVPAGLTVTDVTETSMTLRWNRIVGADYSVRKDGQYFTTTSNNYQSFTGLDPDTTYNFTVASKNSSGELSEFSNALAKKTLADTTNPSVSISVATALPYYENKEILIHFSASDNIAVTKLNFIVKKDGVFLLNKDLPPNTPSQKYTPTTAGNYIFELTGYDKAGNSQTRSQIVIVSPEKKVIVYVPGFMNSEILQDGVEVWPSIRVSPFQNPLLLTSAGVPDNGTTQGKIFEKYANNDYGEAFIDYLEVSNVTVEPVGYDWRRDLRLAAELVKEKVDAEFDKAGGQKINLVTHSTGGIVARYYLLTDATAKNKVKNFINIASPNLGTARALKGLAVGDDLGVIQYKYFPLTLTEMHRMVQNYPAVFQLLPGEKYVNAYKGLYGNKFSSFYQYTNAQTPSKNKSSYSDTVAMIKENFNNAIYEVPEYSSSFRYTVENKQLDSAIKEYRLIGYYDDDRETILKLLEYKGPNRYTSSSYKAIWGMGDGVVSLLSANFNEQGSSTNYYLRSSHIGILRPKGTEPSNMFKIVKSIVADNDPLPAYNYPKPSLTEIKGDAIDILCPVNVVVTDQYGNKAFVDENGFVVNNIEGLTYEIVGESKLLFISAGVKVNFDIVGTDEGEVNLGVTRYESSVPVRTNLIQNLDINDKSQIKFEFTGGQAGTNQTDILYDFNGDGNVQVLHLTKEVPADEYLDNSYIDVTAPTVPTALSVAGKTETTVSLVWQAATDNEGIKGYEIYEGAKQVGFSKTLAYTVRDLKPNASYRFSIKAVDKEGNPSNSSAEVVAITNRDVQAPTVPVEIVVKSKTEKSVTLSWAASTDNVGVAGYDVYKNGNVLAGSSVSTEFTVTGLVPETAYSFTIKSKDASGNISGFSTAITVVTNADTEAPSVPTNLQLLTKTDQTVTLSWSASTDNIAVKNYDIYVGTELAGTSASTSYTVTKLMPDTSYDISIKAKDVKGNASELSSILNVRTMPDTTPPEAPTNLSASEKTATKLKLSWKEAKDNVAVTGYQIYEGSNLIGTTGSTSFEVTSLMPNKLYALTVKAYDAAGNISAASKSFESIFVVAEGRNKLVASNHMQYAKEDGTLWGWGNNSNGQLGDGTINSKSTAVQVPDVNGIVHTAAGSAHTLAVKEDGTVWVWGDNTYGQLGTGDRNGQLKAKQAWGLTDVIAVSASGNTSYALKKDGTVWTWGTSIHMYNLNLYAAEKKEGLEGVSQISAGTDKITALKSDGTVWEVTRNAKTPVQIVVPERVVAISEASGTLALTENGKVWYWPWAGQGSSGKATEMSGLSGVVGIAGGGSFSLALKSDGTVWAWGRNAEGQLGDGTTTDKQTPVQVKGLTEVRSISAGYSNGTAIKRDGTVWTWGLNSQGQLGDGTITNRLLPVQVKDNTAPTITLKYPIGTESQPMISNITRPSIGWEQVDTDAQTVYSQLHVQIADESGAVVVDSGQIAKNSRQAGGSWVVTADLPQNKLLKVRVRVKDDALWSEWTNYGWLKVTVVSPENKLVVSNHALYVKAGGTLWGWGNNSNGQLGDGTINSKSTAVQVPDVNGIVHTAAGSAHTLAVKEDGTVWAWGDNTYGQLGTGDRNGQMKAKQAWGLTDVIAVSASGNTSYALKKDGTVWTWGTSIHMYNLNLYAAEKKEGLEGVSQISAGTDKITVLKSDGTVWEVTRNAKTPVQIVVPERVVAISEASGTLALTESGKVWYWPWAGQGSSGKATEMSGLSGVVGIAGGGSFSLALKSDGTVWAWGRNAEGQLGDGTTTDRSTPVQVKGLTGVRSVSAGSLSSAAIKSDGSIWTWGWNGKGQLGDGTTANRTLPVKVMQ
ncbi:S8 family serine peptidase [Paenibacillus sp. KS-LC4]|uniref:RCC1 domain-containing protein n=1 Tax=Paenibacillus sp. KS-LC4 TaxID=2979727 RepID=UPI0030D533B7